MFTFIRPCIHIGPKCFRILCDIIKMVRSNRATMRCCHWTLSIRTLCTTVQGVSKWFSQTWPVWNTKMSTPPQKWIFVDQNSICLLLRPTLRFLAFLSTKFHIFIISFIATLCKFYLKKSFEILSIKTLETMASRKIEFSSLANPFWDAL